MTRAMTEADRPIVRAYAELRDVDAVIRRLGIPRRIVADVVVNVCGINAHAARALLTGGTVPHLAQRPVEIPQPPPRHDPDLPGGLTARELQVILALADGLTYAQMAARLGRSDGTIRTHLRSAYHKLGAGSKEQAIRAAVELGIISTPVAVMPGVAVAAGLTVVEWETLRLAAVPMSCPAIAQAMGVSGNCVYSRLARVYRKLSTNGRRAAVEVALRTGILVLPDTEAAA